MNNNYTSVSHTIRAEGFKYDVFKGQLSKGSTISKSAHPIPEVEEFKKKLLDRKLLKDMGSQWILKKNLRTGHLMAVNLHMGQLMEKSPYKQDIPDSQSHWYKRVLAILCAPKRAESLDTSLTAIRC